ncbi:hypothetical protein [Kitasatospora sp. NPDC047058]|uniref:hypothetical protein n=1 Tax=Kitasatospora sp. NPDC047058 TaxID=3155620 RepID=UPI0033D156BD
MRSPQDKPRTCAYPGCNVVLPVPKTGRPRKTCSDAHRSAKYRRNKAAEQTTTAQPAPAAAPSEPASREPLPEPQDNVLLLGETIHRSAANFVQALADGRDPSQALTTLRRIVRIFTRRLLEQATAARREALGLPDPAVQEAREAAERIPVTPTTPDRPAFVTARHETPAEQPTSNAPRSHRTPRCSAPSSAPETAPRKRRQHPMLTAPL